MYRTKKPPICPFAILVNAETVYQACDLLRVLQISLQCPPLAQVCLEKTQSPGVLFRHSSQLETVPYFRRSRRKWVKFRLLLYQPQVPPGGGPHNTGYQSLPASAGELESKPRRNFTYRDKTCLLVDTRLATSRWSTRYQIPAKGLKIIKENLPAML